MGGQHRGLIVGILVAAIGVATVGVAAAGVSSGGYSYRRQHCSGGADNSSRPSHVEAGCRSAGVSVADGHGVEGVGTGTQQTADGHNAGALTAPVVRPQAMDLSSGADLNVGADDNLDSGEHDSSSVIHDGPSDGGAVVLGATPSGAARWFTALLNGDRHYLLTHPLPVLAGAGSCADGVCESLQTQRAVAYRGGDRSRQRDVADYQGQTWDPPACGGPTDAAADCGHGGIGYWHRRSPTTYVEPGVQVYEDPNPEGSPVGPYPLPAAAVTTCGVYLGGGPLGIPASPITNGAGQLAIPTRC